MANPRVVTIVVRTTSSHAASAVGFRLPARTTQQDLCISAITQAHVRNISRRGLLR